MNRLSTSIKSLLNLRNASRTEKAKKNILLLFLISIFNFFAIAGLVPVTINYLGETGYGIWLTMAAMLMWLGNLDFGLGNGLRNKLSEALALKDLKLAKTYVSTSYGIFILIITGVVIVFFLVHGFVNWNGIFNAPAEYRTVINKLLLFVFVIYSINFILRLLSSVIQADQMPYINGLLSLAINSFSLLTVYILSQLTESSLFNYGLLVSLVPVLVFFIASIIMYTKYYPQISPSLKSINFKYAGNIVKLGSQFFVIQISSLIVFTTDNLIITQLFGPSSVTIYGVSYKYFYFVPMVFNVVISPFWSAFTEAHIKKDYEWIKVSINKLLFIWGVLSAATIVMILISDFVYEFWVGPEIKVPFALSAVTGLFVILANWNNLFAYFINGVGKIRLQFYHAIFVGILNIPLSIFLATTAGLGLTGIILATCICLFIASIWSPVQYYLVINQKAKGIWNK